MARSLACRLRCQHGGELESAQWAPRLFALGLDARIISAQLVDPYCEEGASGKNDSNDAAATCEAQPIQTGGGQLSALRTPHSAVQAVLHFKVVLKPNGACHALTSGSAGTAKGEPIW